MPEQIDWAGARYRRKHVFKHDFFAATGLYEQNDRLVVVKIGRRERFFGLPFHWMGKMLARHEATQLNLLASESCVPNLVCIAHQDSLLHEFVPGRALKKGDPVGDAFFNELKDLLARMHKQGIAYVDLEKPENVLLGEDGRPYLIDFQISWPWPIGGLANWKLGQWLGKRLRDADGYHLRKLQRRIRPDQLSRQQIEASYRRPWHIRMHRKLFAPFMHIRRWVLAKVDPKRAGRERGHIDHEQLTT